MTGFSVYKPLFERKNANRVFKARSQPKYFIFTWQSNGEAEDSYHEMLHDDQSSGS